MNPRALNTRCVVLSKPFALASKCSDIVDNMALSKESVSPMRPFSSEACAACKNKPTCLSPSSNVGIVI